jgi:hypothetical protein
MTYATNRRLLAAAGALAMAFLTTTPARAHEDPVGCFETGPAIIVSVFRADQTTGVVGTVSECETIYYRATLQKASDDDSICAFSEGTFKLTTPDGTVHDISLDVPCIGGDGPGEGCDDTVNNLVSSFIQYTVDTGDIVGGLITATAVYTGGVAHDTTNNTPGVGANTPKSTPVTLCTDNDLCTVDNCDPNIPGSAACSNTPVVCNDNNFCTTEQCNPATGNCVFSSVTCNDNDLCTIDSCNPTSGCVFTPKVCNDNNLCTGDVCNPATGNCVFTPNVNCDDNNLCTVDACIPATGGCTNTDTVTPTCDDNDLCTDEECDPATGMCETTDTTICNDNDICTDDACNPDTGQCVFSFDPTNDPSCLPTGCRITAGGIAPDGGVDLEDFADISVAYHGGQVGAPCGCIGCFDQFDHVQGQWQHQRKKQKGNFHARDYNSLVCGCDGVLDGNLCGDRDTGPLPRPAPANIACFSGKGNLKRGGRSIEAAFRVEVEDRGEPGAGENSDPTPDVYRMRIWVPKGQETIEGLALGACCTNGEPTGQAARQPEIDDGGDVLKGNIQIHPQIPAHIGECPVPDGVCTED